VVGLDGIDTDEGADEFLRLADTLSEGLTLQWSTRDPRVIEAESTLAQRSLRDRYYYPAWERRKQGVAGSTVSQTPNDLLTLMIHNLPYFTKAHSEVPLREVLLYIHASASNTANQVAFAVQELADWAAAHPGGTDDFTDSEFMMRALHETLRLHPVVPAIFRIASAEVALPSGDVIRPGETVQLNIGAAARDVRMFGLDADKFNPHREIEPGLDHYAFAFGDGPHTCIGKTLVLGDQSPHRDRRQGTAVAILLALYHAGVRPDPDRSATLAPDTLKVIYQDFPVRFESL
jgi:cytochrome P450